MNINSVGNYSPYTINKVNQTQKPQQIKQTENNVISKDEKQFFANMYPDNKTEIVDYHFYQKSGSMSGVTVGSLIDKRG